VKKHLGVFERIYLVKAGGYTNHLAKLVCALLVGYGAMGPSAALGSKKPLDKVFHSLYLQEWKNKARSSAR
jgi:hypothetical protein